MDPEKFKTPRIHSRLASLLPWRFVLCLNGEEKIALGPFSNLFLRDLFLTILERRDT